MKVSSKDQRLGFTVLELLIVVAIIGILAAVSVPLYDHYIAESRKPEASIFLKRIADGAVAYFNEEHVFEKNGTGFYVSWQEYPASKGAMADALGHMPYKSEFTQKRSPNDPNVIAKLNSPPWKDLKMRISSPFYYSYNYQSGDFNATEYTADARAKDRSKAGNIYFAATAGACISSVCKDRDPNTKKFEQPCDSGYVIVGGPKGKVSNILDNSNWKIETDCGKSMISHIKANKEVANIWKTL